MNKYTQFRTSLSFVHNASRQHIIGLYGTPADRQAVLRCYGLRGIYTADSIRDSIRTKKNDSRVPRVYTLYTPCRVLAAVLTVK